MDGDEVSELTAQGHPYADLIVTAERNARNTESKRKRQALKEASNRTSGKRTGGGSGGGGAAGGIVTEENGTVVAGKVAGTRSSKKKKAVATLKSATGVTTSSSAPTGGGGTAVVTTLAKPKRPSKSKAKPNARVRPKRNGTAASLPLVVGGGVVGGGVVGGGVVGGGSGVPVTEHAVGTPTSVAPPTSETSVSTGAAGTGNSVSEHVTQAGSDNPIHSLIRDGETSPAANVGDSEDVELGTTENEEDGVQEGEEDENELDDDDEETEPAVGSDAGVSEGAGEGEGEGGVKSSRGVGGGRRKSVSMRSERRNGGLTAVCKKSALTMWKQAGNGSSREWEALTHEARVPWYERAAADIKQGKEERKADRARAREHIKLESKAAKLEAKRVRMAAAAAISSTKKLKKAFSIMPATSTITITNAVVASTTVAPTTTSTTIDPTHRPLQSPHLASKKTAHVTSSSSSLQPPSTTSSPIATSSSSASVVPASLQTPTESLIASPLTPLHHSASYVIGGPTLGVSSTPTPSAKKTAIPVLTVKPKRPTIVPMTQSSVSGTTAKRKAAVALTPAGNTDAFSGNTNVASGNTNVASGNTNVASGNTNVFSGVEKRGGDTVIARDSPASVAVVTETKSSGGGGDILRVKRQRVDVAAEERHPVVRIVKRPASAVETHASKNERSGAGGKRSTRPDKKNSVFGYGGGGDGDGNNDDDGDDDPSSMTLNRYGIAVEPRATCLRQVVSAINALGKAYADLHFDASAANPYESLDEYRQVVCGLARTRDRLQTGQTQLLEWHRKMSVLTPLAPPPPSVLSLAPTSSRGPIPRSAPTPSDTSHTPPPQSSASSILFSPSSTSSSSSSSLTTLANHLTSSTAVPIKHAASALGVNATLTQTAATEKRNAQSAATATDESFGLS
jgi:hypothetical protein